MRGIASGAWDGPAPRGLHDASVPAMLDEITNTIAELKNTAISYAVILPSLLAVSARLLVQHRGLEATLQALAGAIEMAERGSRVSSSAILGVATPEQPLSHRGEADRVFWDLAHQLGGKGHRINDIALSYSRLAQCNLLMRRSTSCMFLRS